MRICGVALLVTFGVFTVSDAAEPEGLTEADRRALQGYARDTWRSFEAMTFSSGLPADKLILPADGPPRPTGPTSPTDIASYLWSVLAAERLGLVDTAEADRRLDKVLVALGTLRRDHGFFFNWYDPATGHLADRARPFLSTVDNGWLAAALIMVGNARPAWRDRTEALLGPMDFAFFYLPYNPARPLDQPGQLRGGFYPDNGTFNPTYGILNTEPRIASYVAICRGQVPPEHYERIYRTWPLNAGPQHKTPGGEERVHHGVRVFEGHYEHRGMKIVPSWGGSMFEALMVPLFVPEARWAPGSWGVNHPLYTRAHIEQGLQVRRYGVWGFSPALNPAGGYQTYGVADVGTEVEGYHTFNPTGPGTKGATFDGVVTPHASFLALAFAPREAMNNLVTLSERYCKVYGPYGFRDAVDVLTGDVAEGVLAVDQGMIMASIANALGDDAMHHLFCDGPIEATIRPLIADEHFTAAPRKNSTADDADQRR